MVAKFNKFKKQAILFRLLKVFLVGASAFLLVAGALSILARLEIIILEPLYIYLIGGGAFLLGGLITFLLVNTSDRALARKLDNEYKLNEKIQTMLAFKDEGGVVVELQRKSAEEALENVKGKFFDFKYLWIYLLALLLCIGAFVTSFFIVKEEEPPAPVVEVPFKITELQIAALEELYAYVMNSKMDSPYKENTASAVQTLLDDLKAAQYVSEKDVAIDKAINEVILQTDNSSNAVEIMNALWETGNETVRLYAKSLNYYNWPKGNEWNSFVDEITKLRASLVHIEANSESPDMEKIVAETKLLLSEASALLLNTVRSIGVPTDDAIYKEIEALTSTNVENAEFGTRLYGLLVISEKIEELGYTLAQREIDNTFSSLNDALFETLTGQKANTDTGEYVVTKICSIFSCTLPAFERPQLYSSSYGDNAGGEGGEGGGTGGIGGDTVYGSDDLVYDPGTNQYVEYGKILDAYYEMMFGKVSGGSYTEEEQKAMDRYFKILYGGFNEEENE